MRIGIDCRLWNQTGVGRYIRNLLINLQEIDNKNEYIIFARSEDLKDIKLKISNKKWKVVEINIKWHSIAEQIKLPKILQKENLDLMHFPYFSLPISYRKPYVVTIHDLIINHYPTGRASKLFPLFYYIKLFSYKFTIYLASRNAKKIIAPSVATKNEIVDHFKINKEKIIVTHEAVNLPVSNHSQNFIKKYGKYFLYVGNAYPHKNLEKLIIAFNDFSVNKDIKLILVGKKDYFYKRLENKVKSSKIIFFGEATDEDLVALYKDAISLVMPSLMEGFGLPVLEAMANKCLAVCSDIPSLREIAGDNVLYFYPEKTESIKETLNNAYSGNFDKNIIDKAFTLAKQFSWQKMAKETLSVYESSISL